jgi:hypothetical protein
LTARHCITAAIESETEIKLTFSGSDGDISLSATIVAQSEEMDACILTVQNPLGRQPIPLVAAMPREGSDWRSFGYPRGKTAIGHRIFGTISHLLEAPRLKIDIDLTVDPSTVLYDYHGLSGAAVVSENASRGMIRLKVDGTICAIRGVNQDCWRVRQPATSDSFESRSHPTNRLLSKLVMQA